jgi:anthranilate phosphoribosyltransferase
MTDDQARGAMAHLLDDDPDPVTLGAFLLATRWKVNTPTELAGFIDELRERADRAAPDVDAVDCGANYDGKTETAVLGVASGLVAAAAGVPVVAHAGRRLPASRGDTYRTLLDALGVATDLAPAESARMVDETGFGYYAQQRVVPALDGLHEVRESMGVRTPLNTVETLLNPADAAVHLGSFFHLSYGERIAKTLAESRSQPVERAVLIQGLEGYDDVRPDRTTVVEWRGGDLAERRLAAGDLGVEFDREDLAVADVAHESAALTEAVLAGEETGPIADAVALNAAIRLYAGGATESVAHGVEIARERLDGDAPMDRLDALRGLDPSS